MAARKRLLREDGSMKRTAFVEIGLLVTVGLQAALPQERPFNQAPAGFTALFNGKDLTGWRGRQPDYYPRAEAALSKEEAAAEQAEWNAGRDLHWKVDAAKGELVSDVQRPHLVTDKHSGDFEMYVD